MKQTEQHPFQRLTPEFICAAVDSLGLVSDARLFPLNSYENRVYQVGIDESEPLIAKFYRPERWSVAQIIEEHQFTAELLEAELDVIAPRNLDGTSLFEYEGFHFALFDRMGGPPPDLESADTLPILGRLLGRMHAVGRCDRFEHRPVINTLLYAENNTKELLETCIPADLSASYEAIAKDVLALLQEIESHTAVMKPLRCHGDFHLGNMILRDDRIHMLDLDDTRSALAIQDVWMLLNGDEETMNAQLHTILLNYEQFHAFDWREIHLVEYYRTLRIIHHSAWIASRWDDPAFPLAFPWFDSPTYWSNQILTLREQLYGLQQSHSALTGNH